MLMQDGRFAIERSNQFSVIDIFNFHFVCILRKNVDTENICCSVELYRFAYALK